MKRVTGYLITLLCGVALLAISASENIRKESNVTMDEMYEKTTQILQNFRVGKNVDQLTEICETVRNLKEHDGSKSLVQKKTNLIFTSFNLIDKNYTSVYETPQINIAPPGTIYDSGIAPESIKEAGIRAEYEKALDKNKKIAANAIFQSKLGRIRESWLEYMVEYISKNYKTKEQIDKLLDDNITKEESRKELKAKFTEDLASKVDK